MTSSISSSSMTSSSSSSSSSLATSSSSPVYDPLEGNDTSPCTNQYCLSPEDYLNEVVKYILPTNFEWVLIVLYIIVFVVGIVGNLLVCIVVCVEKWMRTTTNLFIVNLSLADFMVLLFCLPTSVLADVTETWYIGAVLCKVVVYLQGVSVSVSVLTLSAISVERYYAICHPLLFQTTARRTKLIITIIWILSLLAVLPELIVLDVHETLPSELTILLTRCSPSWDDQHQFIYQLFIVVFLFCLPVHLMGVAYSMIAYRLWGETDRTNKLKDGNWSRCGMQDRSQSFASRQNTFRLSRSPEPKASIFKMKRLDGNNQQHAENNETNLTYNEIRPASNNMENRMELKNGNFSITSSKVQVLSRRKVAKMLICVVVMFVICYLPVHILNILRYWKDVLEGQRATQFALVAHFLCYFNSAVNPIIYNFMSEKFQKAYRRVLTCSKSTHQAVAVRRRQLPVKTLQTDGFKIQIDQPANISSVRNF